MIATAVIGTHGQPETQALNCTLQSSNDAAQVTDVFSMLGAAWGVSVSDAVSQCADTQEQGNPNTPGDLQALPSIVHL